MPTLGEYVRHVFGSRKRSRVGVVAIALVMAMLLAACGSSGSGKSSGSKNGTPTTAALSGTKPTNPGKPDSGRRAHVRAPGREQRRLVPPRGAARGLRYPGRPLDLRLPHGPERQERIRSRPRRQDHARTPTSRRGRSTSVRASSSTTARRSTRRSSRTTSTRTAASSPARYAAAVHVRVPEHQGRHGHRPDDRQGRHDQAVGVVPGQPLQLRPPRHHGREAAERRQELLQGHDRYRPVHVQGRLGAERPPHRREEPELLAQGQVRPAAAVPRQDHVQAGHRDEHARERSAGEPAAVRPRAHRRHRRDLAAPAGRRQRATSTC